MWSWICQQPKRCVIDVTRAYFEVCAWLMTLKFKTFSLLRGRSGRSPLLWLQVLGSKPNPSIREIHRPCFLQKKPWCLAKSAQSTETNTIQCTPSVLHPRLVLAPPPTIILLLCYHLCLKLHFQEEGRDNNTFSCSTLILLIISTSRHWFSSERSKLATSFKLWAGFTQKY